LYKQEPHRETKTVHLWGSFLPAHCRYERCLLAIAAYNGIEIKEYSLITQIKKLSFIDTLLTIHINCDTILQK